MSDSLRPHESQHARPPCPSPTPGVHSDSHPSSQWCHPAISSSVIPFSSCPQCFPASESFPMSQLFTWGGQSTGVSALASVLGGSEVKAYACNVGNLGSIPGSGRFPWRRKWQPTLVFLPGESHGQKSLVGYSPRSHKESDMIQQLHFTSLPKNTQDWSPLEWTDWISLQSKGLSRVFSNKSINSSVLSFLHSPTLTSIHDYWKNHSLD